jgi:predicted MPP superfamily phosphohydrolase
MLRRPLVIAAAISAVLHAYIAASLMPSLGLGFAGSAPLIGGLLVSALLTPAPLLIKLSALPERRADVLAWAGYLAMGIFSSLFVLTLIRDLLQLIVLIVDTVFALGFDLAELSQVSAFVVVGLTGFISLVGIWNARRLAKVIYVDLPIRQLPAALAGFTIVQLSDIHVGPTIKRGYLDAIVQRANSLNADLVALTGDLIDGDPARLAKHVQPLAMLRSRYGTFGVTGNHEYYHGADVWIDEFRRLGIRMLLNENVMITHHGEPIMLGGVTDFSAGHFGKAHRSDPALAARSDTAATVRILLAHQPRSAPAALEAGFDVQLSGHTHGGQFLPWNFFVPMQQPFVSGLKRLGTLLVYTSRGTGYWGPPMRFGAPSEITVLKLVAAP